MQITMDRWGWTRAETLDFVARMPERERRETLGATGLSGAALADSLRRDVTDTAGRGGVAFGARMDGLPCAAFGAAPDSPMADSAVIWMLSTRECERFPVAFGRWSLRGFAAVRAAMPGVGTFWNWVQESGGSAATLAWLSWLGAWFSTGEKFKSPWTGETFVRFGIDSGGCGHV